METDDGIRTAEAVERGVSLAEGVYLTTTGARIEGDLTLENYIAAVERCELLGNAAVWAIGDLLYYGEQANWGEKYTQAMALTGRSYWSLTQCMRVAKAYPLDERVEGASWSHHRVALSMPDHEQRTALLEDAVTNNVSAEDLRQQLATSIPTPKPVGCPSCNYEWVPGSTFRS